MPPTTLTTAERITPHETPDVESSTDDYARRFAGPVGQYFLDVQAREMLDLIRPWPGARVLDIGGGHAQLAGPLVRAGYQVTVLGSDDRGRDRLDRCLEPETFDYEVGNLLELPFDADSFDVVLAFRMLPHLHRWQTLISEMCRVAQRAIVVDYPDLCSFNAVSKLFFCAKKAVEQNTRPFRCFHRQDILTEFATGGFGSPELRPQFFLPMAAHRVMRSAAVSRTLEGTARLAGFTGWFGSPVIARVTHSHGKSPGTLT